MQELNDQVNHKDMLNINLIEANKALAHRNESLSIMLYNTNNDVNRVQQRNSSHDTLYNNDSSYTNNFNRKLVYESKAITNHIDKFKDASAYSPARLRAQMQVLKEINQLKSQSQKLKHVRKFFEGYRTGAIDGDYSMTANNDQNGIQQNNKSLFLTPERNASQVDPQAEGEETLLRETTNLDETNNSLLENIVWLLEDLNSCRKVALDENKKYVEATKSLNKISQEASKDREAFIKMKAKYEYLLSENEGNVEKSHASIEQLNKLIIGAKSQAHFSNNDQVVKLEEELEKLRNINKGLEDNYSKLQSQVNEKIQLLTTEKELLNEQLEATQEDLSSLVQNYNEEALDPDSVKAKIRAYEVKTKNQERRNSITAQKIQKLKEEFEFYKVTNLKQLDELQNQKNNLEVNNKALNDEIQKIKSEVADTITNNKNEMYQEFGKSLSNMAFRFENLLIKREGEKAENILQNKFEELSHESNGYRKLLEILNNTSDKLESKLSSEATVTKELTQRFEDASKKINEFEEILRKNNLEKDNLIKERDILQAEIKALKENSQQAGSDIYRRDSQINRRSIEYEVKIKQLEEQLEELTRIKQDVKILQQKNQEYESKPERRVSINPKLASDESQKHVNNLKLKEKDAVIKELEVKVAKMNVLEQEITEYKARIEKLENDHKTLLKVHNDLQSQKVKKEATIHELEKNMAQMSEFETKSKEMKAKNQKLEEEVKLQAKLRSQEIQEQAIIMKELEVKATKVEPLVKELTEMRMKYEKLELENEDLAKTNLELHNYSKGNGTQESRIEELESGLERSQKLVREIENQLKKAMLEKEELTKELEDYKKKASHLEAAMLEAQADITPLRENQKQVEFNLAEALREKQEMFKKNKENNEVIEGLKMKVDELNGELNKAKAEKEAVIENYEKNSGGEINMLKTMIEELQKDKDHLSEDKALGDKLTQIYKDTNEELEKCIEEMEKDHQGKIEYYEMLMEELKHGSVTREENEGDLVAKCSTLQKMCDDFELQLEQLTREKVEFEMDLRFCKDENEELKKNLEDMELKYKD